MEIALILKRLVWVPVWVFVVVTAVTACGSSETSASIPASAIPGPESVDLPDGWTRVQVRQGYMARSLPNPLAGFTMDLPPGWSAGESGSGSDGPGGWIAGLEYEDDGRTRRAILQFDLGGGFKNDHESMVKDDRSDIRYPEIEGQPALLHLASPFAVYLGPQVGIYFPRMPGGQSGDQVPSLSIDGNSRGFDDQEQLAQVLSSVRYQEIAALPELPVAGREPGEDWQRTPAREDFTSFSALLPPGWSFESLQGIDTLVGRLTNGEVIRFYDFGGFAGAPYYPEGRIRDGQPNPPHMMWEEALEAGKFTLVQPESDEPDTDAVTGVFASFEPVEPRNGEPRTRGRPSLSVSVSGLTGDQQDLVLAILRTLELEYPGYPVPKQ